MAFIASTDKNVLDTSLSRRANAAARTVDATRKRLRDVEAAKPELDRDMLALHADTLAHIGWLLVGLLAASALVGLLFAPPIMLVAWATVASISYLPLAYLVTRTRRGALNSFTPKRAQLFFLIAHFVSGFGWAALALIACASCGENGFGIVKGILILLAMAATAIGCSAFWAATMATFFLPIVAYGSFGISTGNPIEILMGVVLLLALPFFSTVASILHEQTRALGVLKAEKDHLVSELELSKAHSDEARRRAEEANLAKSRFLASMSHELRTPLNAILGFSEVLAKEIFGPIQNETYKNYAHDIHRSGDHLLKLINDILDLSRIEAGGRELNEEPVMLAEIVADACNLLTLKSKAKAITITFDADNRLPSLRADPVAVRQVALNLLANAIKFTPGGGRISLQCGFTTLGGQYFSVTDNGPGIPEDELDIVLTAFGQGSIAIKNAEQGAGLGLPIVQAIMTLHGGSLRINSKMRAGTTVTVSFPPDRTIAPSLAPDNALAFAENA